MQKLTPEKQQILDKFSKLSQENMKTKLKLIIKELDTEKLPALKDIATALDTNPLIDKDFCIDVYKEILFLSDKLDNIDRKKTNKRLENIKMRLKKIKQQEEIEKMEENPDNLLKDL